MNFYLRYKVLMILLLLMANSYARPESEASDLTKYLEIAARNNPGIRASFFQYRAALERVPQVGALPDPQASMGFFLQPMELVSGNQVGNIGVMQMFPWFGTLKSSKTEASLMAKAKYQQFEADKAELFFRVKSSWYLLNKYAQQVRLAEENLTFLESFEKLALVRFQSPKESETRSGGPGMSQTPDMSKNPKGGGNTGMGGMKSEGQNASAAQPKSSMPSGGGSTMGSKQTGLSDVLRVRMEILDQQNSLALLKDQVKTEEANFNALLNRKPDTRVQLRDSMEMEQLPLAVTAMADSILKNNPMLSMNEAESQSYAAMAEKSRKMGLPMIGLGVNYMFIQKQAGNMSMMNGKDMIMPMVNFSIPIYRKKYKAMKKEAEFLQESAQQKAADLRNTLLSQYQLLVQELNDAQRRVKLNDEQAELAGKTNGLLLSGYTSGSVDFEELIRMQYKVQDYKFRKVEAISDFNTAVAQAEKLMNSFNDKENKQ